MNPLWVCYRVYGVAHSGSPEDHRWEPDTRTDSEVTDNDYNYTGYQRGHMAPKSAMYHCYGQSAVNDTFKLSNATPQLGAFNNGPWKALETLVREEYSESCDEVWIITGPIFDDSNGREYLTKDADHAAWAQKSVEIPDAFYKIIIDIEAGTPRALAFIIDHDEGYGYGTGETIKERLSGFLENIDKIETATGLDFLWLLDDAFEACLEGEPKGYMW